MTDAWPSFCDGYSQLARWAWSSGDRTGPATDEAEPRRVMEVGNEPWHYRAAFYRRVLQGMAQGAKAADPALIVLPGAFQADTPEAPDASEGNYLGARVTAAEAPYLDGLNAHIYSFTTLPDGTRVAVPPEHPESGMHALRNILRFRDANMPGKPVYVTEWGWDRGATEVTAGRAAL